MNRKKDNYMNIYLLKSIKPRDYEMYDSCVVIAPSEQEAVKIHPSGGENTNKQDEFDWPCPKHVICTLLGTAREGSDVGVVCASYNAG
jgi:hypothetical protein